jgi:hypothetical protein
MATVVWLLYDQSRAFMNDLHARLHHLPPVFFPRFNIATYPTIYQLCITLVQVQLTSLPFLTQKLIFFHSLGRI